MYKIFVFFQAYYYSMVSSLNDQWGWAGICLFSHNKTCKSLLRQFISNKLIVTVNIWKSCMCTVVEETNIEVVLAVVNTTELVAKIRPWKKIQVCTGFEPVTSAIWLITESCFHICFFNRTAHIWISYIYSHYTPLGGFIWNQHNEQLPD